AATVKGHRWWLSAAACVLLLTICYRPGSYPAQMPVDVHSAVELRRVLDSFSVVAVDAARPHRGAFAFAALAVAGAVDLLRRNSRAGVAVIAVGPLPVVIGMIATWLLHRPFGVRYVIGGLPGYLLLVAAGIAWLTSFLRRWPVEAVASVLVAAFLA